MKLPRNQIGVPERSRGHRDANSNKAYLANNIEWLLDEIEKYRAIG